MSGTLTPLEEYRDSIGLPEKSILVKYPSPFPSENLLTLYVDDVTTKYNELKQNRALINRKIREYITTICERFNKNVAVFFPSFDLMDNFIDIPISRKLYIESREMLQSDIMETVDTFKISGDKGESGVLFSVVGGRLCEGLDFPDKQLEIAIIVGIPYPKPTAKQKALREYYHKKFNKGWEYAVRTPAVRKLRQCIGRLIRKDTDIGCAIILDKRCTLFRNDLNGLRLSSEPLSDIYKFFN
jgi:DNA excision repair protein ERCC-2